MTTPTTTTTQFTEAQIKDWRAYERVRKGGRYNMFDPRARMATKLSAEKYSFTLHNYSKLKAAAEQPWNPHLSRPEQPELSPPDDPNWALHWYDRLTALNSFGAEQHEREADARDEMRCARNVDAPLETMSRPENY